MSDPDPSPNHTAFALPPGRAPARWLAWLRRHFDPHGFPHTLEPATVWEFLSQARARDEADPQPFEPAVLDYIQQIVEAVLIIDHPSGLSDTVGAPGALRLALLRYWARRLDDPGLVPRSTPAGRIPTAMPPSLVHERLVRAVLRTSWKDDQATFRVDQAGSSHDAAVALEIGGTTWLGPHWTTRWLDSEGPSGQPRWVENSSGPQGELLEWTVNVGTTQLTRMVALLRTQKIAILADDIQKLKARDAGMELGLGESVNCEPIAGCRGLRLVSSSRRPASVYPLGLPNEEDLTRGRFEVSEGRLRLEQPASRNRAFLPLAITWDDARRRRPPSLRILTITQNRRICQRDAAFAVRIAQPGEPGLVFYRSLARPARRTFLGHQTTARILIGMLDAEGRLTPLIQLD